MIFKEMHNRTEEDGRRSSVCGSGLPQIEAERKTETDVLLGWTPLHLPSGLAVSH